jgi:hypothetical protein
MKYTTLPNTDIKSAKFALNDDFGQQNTQAEGHPNGLCIRKRS